MALGPSSLAPGDEIAVVLKGYPRLSETFVAQELRALERRGLRLRLYSLRRPTDPATHPIHREIEAPVTYLPEYLKDDPARIWRAWRQVRALHGYARARHVFLRDLARDRSANRLRRFGQACILAVTLPDTICRIYAHFLHTPASVARYTSLMTGLPWSVSAHAKDIWTTPEWEKREKLIDADWAVTCTASGRDHLAGLAGDDDKVRLVYHGLDLTRFVAPKNQRPGKDGTDPAHPVRILTIGRLVEKKGTGDLLTALSRLPADLHWRLTHIGAGELSAALTAQAHDLGISSRIEWLGAQPQERVMHEYRRADLFTLACRIAGNGDRDGLPNVLMEAQSQTLACLSTRVSAIPELILDGTTGCLVPPGEPTALAEALDRLIRDPKTRARYGKAGAQRVGARFNSVPGIDALLATFGASTAQAAAQ